MYNEKNKIKDTQPRKNLFNIEQKICRIREYHIESSEIFYMHYY